MHVRLFAFLLLAWAFVSHAAIPTLKVTRAGELSFPASDLTTNGIPGLSNGAPRFLVSGPSAFSAQGGRVALVNTQVWARFYSAPGLYDQAVGIAADAEGNVIVAGYSIGPSAGADFVTIKYSPDGTSQWTNRYDGPVHGDDYCRQVLVDRAGNVLVRGDSSYLPFDFTAMDAAVVKYSPDGVPLWTNRFNYYATNSVWATMVTDHHGDLFLGLGVWPDRPGFLTIKCTAAGVPVWTNLFHPRDSYDVYPVAIGIDPLGDAVLTGTFSRGGTAGGYTTLKCSSGGVPLWTNYFQRTFGDQPQELVVDAAGRVFVTGDSSYEAYATVAYASDGQPLWTNFLAHPAYMGGSVPQATVDTLGHVFVTGGSAEADGQNADFTTVKLSPEGVPLWTNRFFESNVGNPALGAIAADAAGQFYLAGHSTAVPHHGWDFVTTKYLADGTPAWTQRFHGPAGDDDWPSALVVDASGAVYVESVPKEKRACDY